MLNNETEEEYRYRMGVASRIKEALDSMPRGGRKRVADECGTSSQALTGWQATGRIDKNNLLVLSRLSNYRWEYIITGDGDKLNPAQGEQAPVTVPIESPPITSTFDVPTNIKLEICKNMTPSTIEMAYNTKSNNLVTAIYRLMNISKEQDRLKVLLEIDGLIQAEIDMEKYVLEPSTPKPETTA